MPQGRRSGVTVKLKATKFQLAAFHTPHTTALSATSCYSPHDFSVCAFCEFRTLDPLIGPRRYGSGSKTPGETKSVDEETNLNSIDRGHVGLAYGAWARAPRRLPLCTLPWCAARARSSPCPRASTHRCPLLVVRRTLRTQ